MTIDKSIKYGIIASLIASIIFLTVLQPLMKFFWVFLNKTSAKLYTSYLNSIYIDVAKGDNSHLDLIIFVIIFMALIGVAMALVMYLRESKKLYSGEGRIKVQDIELIKKQRRNRLAGIKIRYKISIVLVIIYIILFLDFMFRENTCIKLNSDFKQGLNIIIRYIDENQKKELISKWALMRTKDDYNNIKNNIQNCAQANNIKLPKKMLP